MQVKRNEEMERKKEDERARKKAIEREKAERAMVYEEPEWAKVEEEEDDKEEEEVEKKNNELDCVACGKKFKRDKQWKNHEQSKKHKEKVAALREAFRDEDGKNNGEKGNKKRSKEEAVSDKDEFVSADDVMRRLKSRRDNL